MAVPIPILGTYSSISRGAYWEIALHAAAFEGGMKGLNALDAWKTSASGRSTYNFGLGHGQGQPKWKSPSTPDKLGRTLGAIAMNPGLAAAAVIGPAVIIGGTATNEYTRKKIGSRFYSTPFSSGFGPVV